MSLSWAMTSTLYAVPLDIHWASAFSDVVTNGGAFDPSAMLGAPDGVATAVWDGNAAPDGLEETATFSGFGAGATTGADSASLASFLGVSQAVVDLADFVAFEFNGIPFPFEQSRWEFSDGVSSFLVDYQVPFVPPPAVPGVIATGDLTNAAYANFFGPFANPILGSVGFILFDIDGNSAVNPLSPSFTAKIRAGLLAGESPEPDALGVIGPAAPASVPEPPSLAIILVSLAAMCLVRGKKGPVDATSF